LTSLIWPIINLRTPSPTKTHTHINTNTKTNTPTPKVLLRALRDFNLGKLTSDDTSIFMGLLNDLFPKTLELVQRAREVAFETKVRADSWRGCAGGRNCFRPQARWVTIQ